MEYVGWQGFNPFNRWRESTYSLDINGVITDASTEEEYLDVPGKALRVASGIKFVLTPLSLLGAVAFRIFLVFSLSITLGLV